MNYLVIILAIVFFIFILPLSLRMISHLDIKSGRLYYTVTFLKITIKSGYLKTDGIRLIDVSSKGRQTVVPLVDFSQNKLADYFSKLGFSVFKNATFSKINAFFEVGTNGDACVPTILSGIFMIVRSVFFASIKASPENQNAKFNSYVLTKADKDVFELSISTNFSVSLASVILGAITSGFRVIKSRA